MDSSTKKKKVIFLEQDSQSTFMRNDQSNDALTEHNNSRFRIQSDLTARLSDKSICDVIVPRNKLFGSKPQVPSLGQRSEEEAEEDESVSDSSYDEEESEEEEDEEEDGLHEGSQQELEDPSFASKVKYSAFSILNLILNQSPENREFFASSTHRMMEGLPEEEINYITSITLVILRLHCILMFAANVVSNLFRTFKAFSDESAEGPFIELTISWILELVILAGIAYSLRTHKLWVAQPLEILTLVRTTLPLFDLEQSYLSKSDIEVHQFIFNQSLAILLSVIIMVACFSSILHMPIIIFMSLALGIVPVVIFSREGMSVDILLENKLGILSSVLGVLVTLLVLKYVLSFVKLQYSRNINFKSMMQQEIQNIIEHLEVALITKTEKGIGFCNVQGFQMISNIHLYSCDEASLHIDENNNYNKMPFLASQNGIKTVEQQSSEHVILNSKIFILYQSEKDKPNAVNLSSASNKDTSSQVIKYSLKDMFEFEAEDIEKKVFRIPKKYHENNFSRYRYMRNSGEASPSLQADSQTELSDSDFKYVQVKKQKQSGENGLFRQQVLQIIDISDQIMCDVATAEKKLLVLINATVSHEMRNPTNSIYCQNLLQKQQNEKVLELINDKKCKSQRRFKQRLKVIYQQYNESVMIQESSTKLLKFLVNDILDFAQIRAGKFRKNITVFNVQEAIQEIMLILQFKAEQQNIKVKHSFHNFPRLDNDLPRFHDSDQHLDAEGNFAQEQELDFLVFTDSERLQQIIMNILSNALKFTQSGGEINITTKYLRGIEDFDEADFENNLQCTTKEIESLIMQAKHGLVQVSIEDTGIGITVENQLKLFKLFGFLDATKELNAKGIGLGLHISRQIVQEFGGQIVCVSKWEKGTKFVFFFSLDEKTDVDIGVKRRRNPIRKTYPKLEICLAKDRAEEIKENSMKKTSQEEEYTEKNIESGYQTHTYGRSKTIFLPQKNLEPPLQEKRSRRSIFFDDESNTIARRVTSKLDKKQSGWRLSQAQSEERKREDLELAASQDEAKTEFVNYSELPLPRGRSTNKMDVEGYIPEKYPMNPLALIQQANGRMSQSALSPGYFPLAGQPRLPSVSLAQFEDNFRVVSKDRRWIEPSSLALAVFELSLNLDKQSTVWRDDGVRQTNQLNNISEEDSELFFTSSSESDNQIVTSNDFSNDIIGGDEIIMKTALPRSQTMAFLGKNSLQDEKRLNQEKNKRILIVDDEPYNLIGLSIMLQQAAKMCFSHILEENESEVDIQQVIMDLVDRANNGLEAVKLVKKAYYDGNHSYGLILMDCSMPIMDGYEASDNIRNYVKKHGLRQPMIVACTGHTEEEYILKAWRYQMDEVLPKPASLEVIKQLLMEMLDLMV